MPKTTNNSSQSSEQSPKRKAVYIGDDGQMHDIEIDEMSLANMPPLLPKFEQGTDEKGNFFVRSTMDIKIAPQDFAKFATFIGVDLGKEKPTDNKISEEMDF